MTATAVKAAWPDERPHAWSGTPQAPVDGADAIASDGLPWTRTWATAAALRADGGAIAQAVKAAWVDDRPRPNTGTLEAPVLGAPIGQLVALRARMAGYDGEDGEG